MDISLLVDNYLDQIIVEHTEFLAVNDADCDPTCLILNVPTAMLREYAHLTGKDHDFPDGVGFWRKTKLKDKLYRPGIQIRHEYVPLATILDFLGGEVDVAYQKLPDPDRILLDITEVLKVCED